jgi:hypothetical protein
VDVNDILRQSLIVNNTGEEQVGEASCEGGGIYSGVAGSIIYVRIRCCECSGWRYELRAVLWLEIEAAYEECERVNHGPALVVEPETADPCVRASLGGGVFQRQAPTRVMNRTGRRKDPLFASNCAPMNVTEPSWRLKC